MSPTSFEALHKHEISNRHWLTVRLTSFKVCSLFFSQEDVVPRDNTAESPAADVISAISLFTFQECWTTVVHQNVLCNLPNALWCLLCMFLCSRTEALVSHTSAAKNSKRRTWQRRNTTQQQWLRNRTGVLDPVITTVFDVTLWVVPLLINMYTPYDEEARLV